MIERLIFTALTLDLASIRANLALLDKVFQPEGDVFRIDAAELATIKATLTQFPPKIRHGYPYAGTHLPCWAIILGDEQQEKQLLGDFLTESDDAPSGSGLELIGSLERRTYPIWSCGVTPDMSIWYNKILKAIVLRRLTWFRRHFMEVAGYSCQDLEPMELAPEIAFTRTLNLVCRVEEAVESEPFTKIATLDLRHVDAGGAVTPVDPEVWP